MKLKCAHSDGQRVGSGDWLGDLCGILISGDQPHRGNRAWLNCPLTRLLSCCKRNNRVPRPLWLGALHTGFIRLVDVYRVHTSVNTARIRQLRNLLDVFATKRSSIWPTHLRRPIRAARVKYDRHKRHDQSCGAPAHRLTRIRRKFSSNSAFILQTPRIKGAHRAALLSRIQLND